MQRRSSGWDKKWQAKWAKQFGQPYPHTDEDFLQLLALCKLPIKLLYDRDAAIGAIEKRLLYEQLRAEAEQRPAQEQINQCQPDVCPEEPELSPVQSAVYEVLTDQYQRIKPIVEASRVSEGQVRRELPNLRRMNLVEHRRGHGYRRKQPNARALRA
jgi:hypothetical protein